MRKPDRWDWSDRFRGNFWLLGYIDGKSEFLFLAVIGLACVFFGGFITGIVVILCSAIWYCFENYYSIPEVPNSYIDPEFKPIFKEPRPKIRRSVKKNRFTERVTRREGIALFHMLCLAGVTLVNYSHGTGRYSDWFFGLSHQARYLIGSISILLGVFVRVQFE